MLVKSFSGSVHKLSQPFIAGQIALDLTWVTRKSAPARISQPPSFDSVPLSPKLRQPCSSPGLAGARASLDGVHNAKKGPSAKMPTPNDSVTKGHAGSCSVPARYHQHLCLQFLKPHAALTAARLLDSHNRLTGMSQVHSMQAEQKGVPKQAIFTLLPLLAEGMRRAA